MTESRTPEIGDVLFVKSRDSQSIAIRLFSPWLDPDAKSADRSFSHVAIVIDSLLALEACPAPDPKHPDHEWFRLSQAVELGEWTHAELFGGVRLTPIADIVVPAMKAGSELLVLRSPDVDARARSGLSIHHPKILPLLGSKYSLEEIKKTAASIFTEPLAQLVGGKFDLKSYPIDLATKLDIDCELRGKVAEILPDFVLPGAARAFFCSQLVILCLESAGLLPNAIATDLTTPTGLYRLLTQRAWSVETGSYQCEPNPERYLALNRVSHEASYFQHLNIALMAQRIAADGVHIELLEASIEAMRLIAEKGTPRGS